MKVDEQNYLNLQFMHTLDGLRSGIMELSNRHIDYNKQELVLYYLKYLKRVKLGFDLNIKSAIRLSGSSL